METYFEYICPNKFFRIMYFLSLQIYYDRKQLRKFHPRAHEISSDKRERLKEVQQFTKAYQMGYQNEKYVFRTAKQNQSFCNNGLSNLSLRDNSSIIAFLWIQNCMFTPPNMLEQHSILVETKLHVHSTCHASSALCSQLYSGLEFQVLRWCSHTFTMAYISFTYLESKDLGLLSSIAWGRSRHTKVPLTASSTELLGIQN